jgi:leucyl/phenylalanyl-tRNA--protein transferase
MNHTLTPELLVRAYRAGIFPMGHDGPGPSIRWYRPDPRAVLPLEDFHAPHNLRRRVRQDPFEVVSDRDFEATIRGCADRNRTWITDEIIAAYTALHEAGYAHSVECWQDDRLVGGLYGVAVGAAFFGESMFHRADDASKVALVHLVRQLRAGGYRLLDTQYTTPHLERFGVVEIPREAYERRLARAVDETATWWPEPARPVVPEGADRSADA